MWLSSAAATGLVQFTQSGAPEFGRPVSRWAIGYLWLIALMMGGVHLSHWFMFVKEGRLPGVLIATGHPTNVVAALDLLLVVAPSAFAASWLIGGRPVGLTLGVFVCLNGALYMTVLTCAVASAYFRGATDNPQEAGAWIGLGFGCFLTAVHLLRAASASSATGTGGGTPSDHVRS